MMDCAAYETVALGYSSFTDLFDKSDWKAYEYRSDLLWTKYASFGQPTARAQGVGWVQELVARLTHSESTLICWLWYRRAQMRGIERFARAVVDL